jgi:hypothetical protein
MNDQISIVEGEPSHPYKSKDIITRGVLNDFVTM